MKISLPSGGFVMYSAFSGHVLQAKENATECPECGLYKSAGLTMADMGRRCVCGEGFIEKTAFGCKWAEIPEKYANVLSSFRQAGSSLERVAPMNQNFAFFRVMGLHGDEFNTNGDLFTPNSHNAQHEHIHFQCI